MRQLKHEPDPRVGYNNMVEGAAGCFVSKSMFCKNDRLLDNVGHQDVFDLFSVPSFTHDVLERNIYVSFILAALQFACSVYICAHLQAIFESLFGIFRRYCKHRSHFRELLCITV